MTSKLDTSAEATAHLADAVDRRFAAFHLSHPEVYRALAKHARTLRKARGGRGVVRISSVFSLAREEGVEVNDLFRGRYARLLMRQEKDLANAFETRRMRT